MKYGNTSRSLCVIFQGLIFAIFASFGLYFGVFVVPFFFAEAGRWTNGNVLPFNLCLELAVFGLSVAIVSGYGLYKGLIALSEPSDDKPVVSSFVAFIVEGYLAALFFFLQAAVYFDLTTTTNVPFIVILSLILTIGLLIAANIPMVKLFDGKDSTPIFVGISFGGGITMAILSILSAISLIVLVGQGPSPYYIEKRIILLFYIIFPLLAALCAIAAGVIYQKKGRNNPRVVTLSGLLDSAAVFFFGIGMLFVGVYDYVWSDGAVHFEGVNNASTGQAYYVCSILFGILIALAGVAAVLVTLKDAAKKGLTQPQED